MWTELGLVAAVGDGAALNVKLQGYVNDGRAVMVMDAMVYDYGGEVAGEEKLTGLMIVVMN